MVAAALMLPAPAAEAKRRRRRRKPVPQQQPALEDDLELELELEPLTPPPKEPVPDEPEAQPPDLFVPESMAAPAPTSTNSTKLEPTSLVPPTIDATTEDLRSPWSNPLVWVVGGLGIASVATGALFGLRSRAQFSDGAASTVQVDRKNLNNDGQLSAFIANSLLGAGVALLGGASVVVLLRSDDTRTAMGAVGEGAAIQPWGIAWRHGF